jgi:hypothetical protein
MDILERVKKFRLSQRKLKAISLKARSGDPKAAFQLMGEIAKDTVSERELMDGLIKEVKKLRKQLESSINKEVK